MTFDTTLFGDEVPDERTHQNQLPPTENKFHVGNGDDGKHYWLTPPDVYGPLNVRFNFDFDPCPYPLPEGFDGLACEWGQSSYVNPPFGSIIHQGKKKGPTAWVRKALAEHAKGKRVVLVYPVDKWLLMLLEAGAKVENLRDVKWLATEDGSAGKGTGRHIACFILEPKSGLRPPLGRAAGADDCNPLPQVIGATQFVGGDGFSHDIPVTACIERTQSLDNPSDQFTDAFGFVPHAKRNS